MGENISDQQHEIEDRVDYISNLPDCILHHIISRIPTKEVVKTSVLSPRWKNLWASVPNLNVDASTIHHWKPPKLTSFLNFLQRRLRGESNIKNFCLICTGRNEKSQIHGWISDAIAHNLQELELIISLRSGGPCPLTIPWSTLDSTSLVSLKITAVDVGEVPSCISFPCLKSLKLQHAEFSNDGEIQKLLLGCPVVEELFLLDNWMKMKNIVISSSTLKRLTIHDMSIGLYIVPDFGCKMKIDAENVTYFEYSGYLPHDIMLNNASSLVKACINILPSGRMKPEIVRRRAVNLLKPLQFVSSLSVSETAIQYTMFINKKRARFPKFENLRHLELLASETKDNAFGTGVNFLHVCPSLQCLCISQGFIRFGGDDSIWPILPNCISISLKTVSLKDFCGNDSEICFLRYILKHARVLERLDIWCYKGYVWDFKRKTKVTKELENIERSSTTCVINFF